MIVNEIKICQACNNPAKEICISSPLLCGHGVDVIVSSILRRAVKTVREAVANGEYVLENGISEADLIAVDERWGR